jgi:hypothetical protein
MGLPPKPDHKITFTTDGDAWRLYDVPRSGDPLSYGPTLQP